jgi:hypothetical protein
VQGEAALADHEKALARKHSWTADSTRVTADALTALGRIQEADAIRMRYGIDYAEYSRGRTSRFAKFKIFRKNLAPFRSRGYESRNL